jgi:hypothetical protein
VSERGGRARAAALAAKWSKVTERCEMTDLRVSECAHCLGHSADWEVESREGGYE